MISMSLFLWTLLTFPLKRQTVSKEAIYIAIGIREDGTKEVLSYAIAPTESTYVWNELLQDINSRGVPRSLAFFGWTA